MKQKQYDFKNRKNSEKIVMLTGYDYPTAKIINQLNIDIILVGDSLGTTVLGYDSVSEVTMEDMVHHTKAVARGSNNTFILSDMPFGSCSTPELAVKNAQKLINAGAQAVKIESEKNAMASIKAVIESGIEVCGHIGFTPQTVGLKASVQGKDIKRAKELIELAKECDRLGTFMIVLELLPRELADFITKEISIPTIGIGSGNKCDGEVQVIGDILGISEKQFRHTKRYANLSDILTDTIKNYSDDVRNSSFPTNSNSSNATTEVMKLIRKDIK